MKEFSYTIKDKQGIHARPAGIFVKEAASYPCNITISKDGKEANGKNIFGVMSLNVKCGEEIVVKLDGAQEDEACTAIKAVLEDNL